jgi:hypothetical protein
MTFKPLNDRFVYHLDSLPVPNVPTDDAAATAARLEDTDIPSAPVPNVQTLNLHKLLHRTTRRSFILLLPQSPHSLNTSPVQLQKTHSSQMSETQS